MLLQQQDLTENIIKIKEQITSITGFADLLKESTYNKLTDKEKEYLKNIIDCSSVLNKELSKLMQFAAKEQIQSS